MNKVLLEKYMVLLKHYAEKAEWHYMEQERCRPTARQFHINQMHNFDRLYAYTAQKMASDKNLWTPQTQTN